MKNIILTILFILSFIPTSAQVNKSIWDFSLGNTRSNAVSSYLHNHKMDYEDFSEIGLFEVNKGGGTVIKFGGQEWDDVQFQFENDVLSGAYFSKKYKTKEEYEEGFSSLRNALVSKYHDYLSPLFIDDSDCLRHVRLEDNNLIVVLIRYDGDLELQLRYAYSASTSTDEL